MSQGKANRSILLGYPYVNLTAKLNEFHRIAFRKKIYESLDELQADIDAWLGV
ncbi:MAG TPA: hypothetical protein VGX03_23690 [Candidatus Binatia bacterium]|nr:hypothetical protein [Candidatus Binatia bacterium]